MSGRSPRVVITITRRWVVALLWIAAFAAAAASAYLHPTVIVNATYEVNPNCVPVAGQPPDLFCGNGLILVACAAPQPDRTCPDTVVYQPLWQVALGSAFAATVIVGGLLGVEWVIRNVRFRFG